MYIYYVNLKIDNKKLYYSITSSLDNINTRRIYSLINKHNEIFLYVLFAFILDDHFGLHFLSD